MLNTIVTKKEFDAYNKLKAHKLRALCAIPRASKICGLTPQKMIQIANNYAKLSSHFLCLEFGKRKETI